MADEQIQQPEEPDDKTVKEKAEDESNKPGEKDEIADNLKSRIEAAKRNRKQFYNEWKRNVELRLGRIASQYTGGVSVQDEVQTEVNPDWFLTKTKTANLFSKVPKVQGTHENKQYAPAVPPFLKALNYELGDKRVDIGTALEEELNDVVNAAGVGAILLGWMARFEMKSVPDPEFIKKVPQLAQLPPEIIQKLAQTGKIPMTQVPQPVNGRFYAKRVSPVELLWPAEFSGSNLNDADFAGHSGRLPEGVAKGELNLTDEELKKVLGNDDVPSDDTLRSQPDKGGLHAARVVKFDQIFYWRHRVDPECKYFDEIWRLVYVDGIDKPKIHEPYKGQQLNEQTGEYIGVRKYPIQFLTLTYISDNPVPPSDSSAGRPQVNDMRRSRAQMFQQRERSIPVRWYNVNGVDPLIADTLMRGTWQGMIPTNGDGSRFIGEIARASYPSEDLSFDAQNKKDLMELWQISPEQLGVPGGRQNKEQTQAAQAGFSTRMGQERGRVASHFLNICEVLAGLMVMFGTFPNLTEQEKAQMTQAWDLKHVVADLVLNILPDSTIMLDTSQRIERLLKFLNMTVKSGFINPKPIIVELAELSGLDPTEIVVDPKPKEPEEPNLSMRFTGKDDLMNLAVMAMLVKGKRAPSPEDIANAKKIQDLVIQLAAAPPEPQQSGAPGAPGQPGDQEPPPPGPGRPPGPPHPPGAGGAGAHPEWSLADKVAKRSRDMTGGGA